MISAALKTITWGTVAGTVASALMLASAGGKMLQAAPAVEARSHPPVAPTPHRTAQTVAETTLVFYSASAPR